MPTAMSADQPSAVRPRTRRRVHLLLPSLNSGGAQQVYLTMARLLADHHDVRLVVVDTSGPLRHEVPDEVTLVDLGCGGVSRALPALVRHLRTEAPDALLPSIDHTNLLAVVAARLAGRSTVVLPRVANTLSQSQATPTLSNIVIRWGTRLLYPRLPAIVVPSHGVARDLVNLGVPEASVRVVPNPVVGRSLLVSAAEPLAHPWFQPDTRREVPVIVAMGRLVPQKDFGMLIDAWVRTRATQRTRLVILGEGPERADLVARASAADCDTDLDMPGYVANPAPYLSGADLFVLSSRWEGLPGALIQALACGTPAVATDCPSGPREILDGGRHGRLVDVGDTAGMAAALADSLRDPITPGRSSWRPYSEEAALEGYLDVIDELSSPTAA